MLWKQLLRKRYELQIRENKMDKIELIGKQQLEIENNKIKIAGYNRRMGEIQNIITKDNGLKDKIELIYAVSLESDVKDILNLCY